MLIGQKNLLFCFFVALFFLSPLSLGQAKAREIVSFGPREAKIEGSIAYTVIGNYQARFRAFQGKITFDEKSRHIESVYLRIDVRSILSNNPWCDRMAKSRRLLNAARYPYIIFKSDQILYDQMGVKVKGVLEMHGNRRAMTFHFNQYFKKNLLFLHGSWSINRKDFNIIWNRYLDHGGVLVADHFIVDWGINLIIK